MYPFTYYRPKTLTEAVALAAVDGAKLLAGGQTLLPTMKQRLAAPEALVDMRDLGLSGIDIGTDTVSIGAMTHHAEVAASPGLRATFPALGQLAGLIGDPSVRNRGTIGGSVANNDPAADYPAAFLATNASIITDRREIVSDAFFQGMFTTALEEGEIITAVRFPIPLLAAYEKLRNPASRYATAGVFIARTAVGVRVAVTGAGADGVMRVPAIEEALERDFAVSALDAINLDPTEFISDIHADSSYRAHVVVVVARRALARIVGPA